MDKARKAAKKKTTSRLEVSTSPAGKPVYVGGRKVGVGPVSIRVPAGEYRVEADWGHRGMVRTVTVPSAPVELSAAVEGAIYPDGGPCVEATDATAALSRASRVLPATRLLGVHAESAGEDSYMVVTSVSGGGQEVREARVQVQPGAPTSEALALLAGLVGARARATPLVEVTKGPGAQAPVGGAGRCGGSGGSEPPGPQRAAPPRRRAPTPHPASPEPDPNATHFEAALRALRDPAGRSAQPGVQNGSGSDQT